MVQSLRSHCPLPRPTLTFLPRSQRSQGHGAVEDRLSPGEPAPQPARPSGAARVKEALVGALAFAAPGLIAARFGCLGMLAGIAGLTALAALDARHHHEDAVLPGLAAATYASAATLIIPAFFAAEPAVGMVASGALALFGMFKGEHCLLQSTCHIPIPPEPTEY